MTLPTLHRCLLPLFSLSLLFPSASVRAEDHLAWPDRSGPTQNGHVAEQDARNFPTHWEEADAGTQNVAWKIKLEGEGHSTPVIGRGHIWLTAATSDGKQQFVYMIDEQSGQVLLHRQVFENEDPEPLGNKINTYASPSPVMDATGVYVHFGTYGTAKLDHKTGATIWERRDINGRHFRGPGSSPVLFEDLLILTFDCIDTQFLIALNTETGETVWRTERTTDYGDLDENGLPKLDGDYRKAYSTPGVVTLDGQTQVVSVGAKAGFGYDARTGKELWTFTHGEYNAAAKPSFLGNQAIVNSGSRNAKLLSIRLDDTTRGNIDETHVTWLRSRGNSDLSNPLLHEGLIYMVANNGVAVCVDAETGEEVWTDRIGGTFVASPIVANDLIYFSNEEGVTTVIRAGRKFDVVARNKLAEGVRASPAAANGAYYLRTFGHLYKIQND